MEVRTRRCSRGRRMTTSTPCTSRTRSTLQSTAAAGAWMQELPWHNGVLMLVTLGWLNLVGGRTGQNPELVRNWPEVFRHLPVREMDSALGRELGTWREWVDHPTLDTYWNEL